MKEMESEKEVPPVEPLILGNMPVLNFAISQFTIYDFRFTI